MRIIVLGLDQVLLEDIYPVLRLQLPRSEIREIETEAELFAIALEWSPDLVLLGMDASRQRAILVQRLRYVSNLPLLVVGSPEHDAPIEEAEVLESGADEYVYARASQAEFLARIGALLRRTYSATCAHPV